MGPADGRYVLRPHAGEDASHVVVLATLGAPQRRLLHRRRRARPIAPQPPPTPVMVTRATVIDAQALPDEPAAAGWLRGVDDDACARAGLAVLNRIIRAHRAAAADIGARDVTRAQALAVRIGYGAGEEVAEGRWRAARELSSPAVPRRSFALRSQERLAALLGGRDVVLACEELALRARADLDAGSSREAALTLRVALEAALAELAPWAARGELQQRLVELGDARAEVAAAANRALEGGLDATEEAAVARVLGRIEAALRARTAEGFE